MIFMTGFNVCNGWVFPSSPFLFVLIDLVVFSWSFFDDPYSPTYLVWDRLASPLHLPNPSPPKITVGILMRLPWIYRKIQEELKFSWVETFHTKASYVSPSTYIFFLCLFIKSFTASFTWVPPTFSFKRIPQGSCYFQYGQSMEHTQFGIKDGPLNAAETTSSHLLPTLGLSQERASLFEAGMGPSVDQWVIDGTHPMPSPVLGV